MTISSDDPPFMRTTLTEELRHVVRLAGLSRDDLAELQRRAARAAFADGETKAAILYEIDRWASVR
jgi:adenosine deaminase